MIRRLGLLWAWLTETNMKKLGFVGASIAAVVGAGWAVYIYQPPEKPLAVINLITEGDNFLNIGRYGEAKQSFSKALAINSQDKRAAWGLKKTELWDAKDSVAFKQNLDNLYNKNPNDAQVNLFYGKFYGADHHIEQALPYYRKAIEINANIAEAHFDLGVLYEQQGKQAEAKAEYTKAVALSTTPKYQANLAYFFVKQKDYDQALEIYGQISNFPLVAVEMAKIYWLRGELQTAENLQRQALQLLEDKDLMATPENQDPWYFTVADNQGLELIKSAEKKDYTQYCLSVSLFLQGKDKAAREAISHLSSLKQRELKSIISSDLNSLEQANRQFSKRVALYQALFLTVKSS
ncbi:MAG: tetratricopeptide repeat protein [Methylococcales bacterium]